MRILPLALLLAACGGKSDDPVVLLQQERDPGLRTAAVQKLLDRGPGETRLWKRLLGDGDPEIARLTASALGRAASREGWDDPPDSLLDGLLAATRRPEPAVRAEAVGAIGLLWAAVPRVPAKVAPCLSDPDPRVRRSALRAFRDFGPSTAGLDLAPLMAILRTEPSLALDAALALAACGDGSPGTLERLCAAATDPSDPALALEATRALSRLGPRGVGGAGRLAASLPGAPEALAGDIAHALGALGDASPPVVLALEKALEHRWSGVRLQAALSLAHLGRAGPKAEAELRTVLKERAPRPRVYAAEGMALLGKEEGAATSLLRSTVADASTDPTTRSLAAESLGRLAASGRPLPAEALAALEAASKDADLDVRRAALRALAAARAR